MNATKEQEDMTNRSTYQMKTKTKITSKTRINHTKSHDIIQQTWIIEFQYMLEISVKVMHFITKAIENRKLELTAGRQNLAEAEIQRGILGEKSLSLLLFDK